MLLPVLLPSTDHLLQNRKGVINDTVPSQKACMLQTSQIMLFGSFFFFYVPVKVMCLLNYFVFWPCQFIKQIICLSGMKAPRFPIEL